MAKPELKDEGTRMPDIVSWIGSAAIVAGILLAARKLWQEPTQWDLYLVTFLVTSGLGVIILSLVLGHITRQVRSLTRSIDPVAVRASLREELVPHEVHRSIHHLFSDRDLLRPRGGGKVDMILDGAELPTELDAFLREIRAEDAEARILILDPSSPLVERHRYATVESGDSKAAAEHVRSKIQAAIDELRPLATVRLYDAVPLGNLIIVDDHVFWGGIPSVPTDVSLPIVSITVDTREHLYWAFRRNFDALWKGAKPVEPSRPKAMTAAVL